MEYGFLSRAGKFLQEQKKHRRWMAVFLCLAAGVTLGTLGFLKLYGQAMTHQVRMLDCKYEVHVHTDECYAEDEDGERFLICAHADEADYVIHVHNDDCYDNNGELVCPLEEHEKHEHTDDCWEETEVLVCELEETEGTVSMEPVPTEDTAESSQETEQPEAEPQTELVQICEKEEHEHSDECYPIDCGLEEHSHDDSCITSVLICETEEHSHGTDCYDEEGNQVCETEEHTHDDSCYEETYSCGLEEHAHDDSCRAAEPSCGLEAHVHDESCYEERIIESTEPVQPTEETVPEVPAEQPAVTEGHVHTEECYRTERVLVCGELELHTHNTDPGSEDCCYDADCFDEEGRLIEGSRASCGLLQLEEHVHTEDKENPENSCFRILELTDEEVAALNGGATLHVHTDDCYDEEGNLICGHEVTHLHQLDCYDEDGHLICGFGGDSHEHDAKCYDEEGNLTCGFEDAKDHEHDAGCYDEEGILTCGYEGVKDHEHRAECYDEEGSLICGYEGAKDHEHDAGCYNEEGILICGFNDAKVHEHDAGCYDEEGNLICGYEGAADHEHVADCYDIFGNLICGYEGVSDHVHTEECYDEEGNLICGKEVLEIYEQSKAYECDSYIVVARYNDDAEIPEEAEFLAEQITADSDQEHYASRETEYRNELRDETASMRALLKIGFYVDEEDGRVEVEPKTPVAVAVQFLDEDGLAEGKPITIIHFAEEGLERLDGSKAKNNSTSFKMNSFSEIAIGYEPEKKAEINENGTIHIADDYECDADPFHIVFHVEGDAKAADGSFLMVPVSKAEDTVEDEAVLTGAEEEAEDSVQPEVQPVSAEDTFESGEEGDTDMPENEADTTVENVEDIIAQNLKFHVKSLNDDPEIQKALVDYIGESDNTVSRNILHTISYHMTYEDVELDLSGCTVTAEVTLNAVDSGDISAVSEQQSTEADVRTAENADGTEAESEGGGDAESENTEGTEADVSLPADVAAASAMSEGSAAADAGQTILETADAVSQDALVVNEIVENTEVVQAFKSTLAANDPDTEISVMAISVSETGQVSKLADMDLHEGVQKMDVRMNSGIMAFADESASNPVFMVQYYAYAQIMEDTQQAGTEAITIIDTVKANQEGVFGGAQLPSNSAMPNTKEIYVKEAGSVGPYTEGWPVYDPVYKSKDSTDSLTKIYTSDPYEFREMASGLEHINKFAKDGLNYDLVEVWVLKDGRNKDSIDKDDWAIYSGDDIEKLVFTNNDSALENQIAIQITRDTVIRLVGRSNTEVNKNYPARFFDYDFTNGTNDRYLQGINNPSNYEKDANGDVITPRYGFGNNSSGATGLRDDQLDGHNINIARSPANTIIGKCSFGLVESALSDGYPVIKANAPDIFNPLTENVIGRTEISGYSLNFNRDGDTYTLTSVGGSGSFAQNLDQFQKRPGTAYGTTDQIWTNQFWPMDSSTDTFGTAGHDPKFGSEAQNKTTEGMAVSDDKREHNSFFGMTFEVEFELTDDYVGPLNYYFFGDDDMWVFLEYPDGTTQLVCDIGGVHQAAGEYVDLWNYIQKPQDKDQLVESDINDAEEERVNPKYKLKFFYTERGASGSTCWMQFTLPSVNAVPVIDYTGNVKSTLKLGKTVAGEETDELFDFTIEFKGQASNIASNDYPYQIRNKDGVLVKSGDIRSGGIFQLGHEQTIEIFNIPDNTEYVIKEAKYAGYEPELGTGNTSGTITKDKTVEGNIDWKEDDIVDYINKEVEYNLPETGGPGPIWYMIAGAFFILLGTGLMYNKKFGERRV